MAKEQSLYAIFFRLEAPVKGACAVPWGFCKGLFFDRPLYALFETVLPCEDLL